MKSRNNISTTIFVPILFLGIGLLMVFHPMLLSGFALMQTEQGDTRLNNYFLEHSYLWLNSVNGHQEFWNMPFFYPEKNTAAFSDIHWGVAPFYWVWRVVGLASDTSYQMWLLTLSSLNFLVFHYVLSRQFKLIPLSSSFGAFLFAFGCSRTSQIAQSQLIAQFYSVIAIYALTCLFYELRDNKNQRKRTFYVVLFFAALVLQIFTGFYNGWYLIFALSLAFGVSLLFSDYRKILLQLLRKHPVVIILSAVASGLVLFPMVLHYYDSSQKIGFRIYSSMVEPFIPRILSWFAMGSHNWLYGWADGLFNFNETLQIMGVGYTTLILSSLGLWQQRHKPFCKIISLTTLFLIVVSSVYPRGYTLWTVIFNFFPGAMALRYVHRIGILLLIPASFGLAFFVQNLLKKEKILLALFLGIFSLLEQGTATGSYEKIETRERVASLVSRVSPDCESFLLIIPENRRFVEPFHIDAMWAALETGVPTINGYTGGYPRGWYFSSIVDLNEENLPLVNMALNKWVDYKGLNRSKICTILQ